MDIITVQSTTIKDAFIESFKKLYETEAITSDPDLVKELPLILIIRNREFNEEPAIVVKNNKFVLKSSHKDLISDSRTTVQKVMCHYNSELFDSGKVDWVIKYMKGNKHSRRAIINIWQDQVDSQIGKDSPCVIYFWFRKIHGSLNMHTHMRANDAFRKFMLNLEIFLSLQKLIAKKTGTKPGEYLHFVDSFHFYKFNQRQINKLHRKLLLNS